MTSPAARAIVAREMPGAIIVDPPMTAETLLEKYGGSPAAIAQNVGLTPQTGSEMVTIEVPLGEGQPKSLGRRTLIVDLDQATIVGASG